MTKYFLTYEQQLEKLQQEKELTIPDPIYARKTLEELSYYSLINGYKKFFRYKPPDKYLQGVTFDEIVAFYYFDEKLRTLFFQYILHVERHMKSLISYHFCEKYGENQTEYLNPFNFNPSKKNRRPVSRLIQVLTDACSLPNRYRYIEHYATKYHNVPLWVTVNVMNFGQISAFYQYMAADIQVRVSKHFPGCSEKQLHQFITVIAKCRNVCAHGERLYNFQSSHAIPDTVLHRKLSIPMKNGQFICGKQDLFAVVIALRYLISKDDFKKFKANLSRLIHSVLEKCPHISKDQLQNAMGFPENWASITRF